jgi:hypothetical protein
LGNTSLSLLRGRLSIRHHSNNIVHQCRAMSWNMITVCRLLAVRHWILRRSIFVTATRKTCGPNKHISQLNARRVYAPITLAQVRFKCTVAGQQNERNVAPHGFTFLQNVLAKASRRLRRVMRRAKQNWKRSTMRSNTEKLPLIS